jgi:hypothetical protein
MQAPPLALHKSKLSYAPRYGDYIIWARWFSTWHGLVIDYDKDTDEISVIMAGLPFLLFTMDESDHQKETVKIKLSDIRKAPNGKYAIQTVEANNAIWYI